VTGVFAASASSADDPATTADLLAKAVAARGLRALDRPVSAAGPAVTRIRWSSS
jgi:3-hydroxyisobutyrate dehydrogenase-like beta-hydroxyacid dehydrogenase